jgi:hypothetical protein
MSVTAVSAARPSSRDASPKIAGSRETAASTGATGVIGPFNDPRGDGAAPVTLAYAAQPPARSPASLVAPAATGPVATGTAPRSPAPAAEPQIRAERALDVDAEPPLEQIAPRGTTVAMKRVANQVASAILSASASSVVAIKAGVRLENPWLRAVLVAPNVHRFLTTLALGVRDFRTLAALMVKPRSTVMMTFAADPNPGLTHDRFTGPAVVFVSTVTYPMRAAVLQQ